MIPILVLVLGQFAMNPATSQATASKKPAGLPPAMQGGGELRCFPKGKPAVLAALKGTEVEATLQGFGARVTIVQTFRNPSDLPVEAVYTFPLPHDAAVDRMRIQVGSRIIEGSLKRRAEARAIYEVARQSGQTAALLEQETDNVFTQSIANLTPGAEVKVEISYVQLLKYEDGEVEFSYPMVVGPRYIGASTPHPDKIVPPYAAKGTRSGADIQLHLQIAAGAPIQSLRSVLHEVKARWNGDSADVSLAKKDEIPNRDFILRYRLATEAVQSAFLTHYEPNRGGFFSLVLLPPARPVESVVQPKELVFVMDQSGSQNGFPIEKSKELTLKLIQRMGPRDTFNVMGFSEQVNRLWPTPRSNTAQNRQIASDFVKKLSADGGTELQKAVIAALAPQPDPQRLRYVVFNTDAFVGQEKEILQDIRKFRGNSRMFVFGIGNGVNRALVDAMSAEGRGDSEVVTLREGADLAVQRFLARSGNPILTDLQISSEGGEQVTPSPVPDVLADKPIVIFGRYRKPGPGRLVLSGKYAGRPWSRTLDVNFSPREDTGDAVMRLWAKRRVSDLARESYLAENDVAGVAKNPNAEGMAEQVALDYQIMSEYTSFVAIEKRVVNVGGKQRTIRVPVDMTEGVNLSEADVAAPASLAGFASGAPAAKVRFQRGAGGPGGFAGGAAALPQAQLNRKREVALSVGDPYQTKVDAKLRKAVGRVGVQIRVRQVRPETLQKLTAAGFKLEARLDDLKVLVGTIDASKLKAIAKLDDVLLVFPNED